jgi:DNA-binding IclR family transcriptional regulator
MSAEADTRLEGDRQFVVALQRGLEILRCFRPSDGPLGNTELASRSGLPQSTVSRLTYTLSKLGYLVYLEDEGRYRIGLPALGLGYSCLAGFKIRHAAQPLMNQLADFAGNGVLVALGGRADFSMIYIACARSPGVISLQLDVGSRVSMRRSSIGRAYLTAVEEAERRELMQHFEAGVEPGRWPQLQREIARSQEDIESKGYCINLGEWHDEIHSIAVPIPPSHPGSPALAVNCGGPAYLLSRDRLENELAPRLVALAQKLRQWTP